MTIDLTDLTVTRICQRQEKKTANIKAPNQNQDHGISVQTRMRAIWAIWSAGSVIQITGFSFAYWTGIVSFVQYLLIILLLPGGFGVLFYLVGRHLRASGEKNKMPSRRFMRGYYIGIACVVLGPLIWALLQLGIIDWFGLGGAKLQNR